MGNHEFNAIAYATEHPTNRGQFLRGHSGKNHAQHAAFLAQVTGTDREHYLSWFKTLPLWPDLGGLRVIHACWHEEFRFLAAAHSWVSIESAALQCISQIRIDVAAPTGATGPSTAEVRAWARTAGLPVPDRGRLRPDVRQVWRDAHGDTTTRWSRRSAPALFRQCGGRRRIMRRRALV